MGRMGRINIHTVMVKNVHTFIFYSSESSYFNAELFNKAEAELIGYQTDSTYVWKRQDSSVLFLNNKKNIYTHFLFKVLDFVYYYIETIMCAIIFSNNLELLQNFVIPTYSLILLTIKLTV